jgi:hypothetical protein
MIDRGLIDTSAGLTLTPRGNRVLTTLGVPTGKPTGRPMLRDCLDWTERREHLAGSIPAALLNRALEASWLERGSDRAIHLRPTAAEPLAELGVDLAHLAEPIG